MGFSFVSAPPRTKYTNDLYTLKYKAPSEVTTGVFKVFLHKPKVGGNDLPNQTSFKNLKEHIIK